MSETEKIILILGIVIVVLLVLNIFRFFNKNKSLFSKIKKSKINYTAIVIEKRHYVENNRDLYYVKFLYNEREEEFLVDKYLFNELYINQEGILTLKYDYFYDFK